MKSATSLRTVLPLYLVAIATIPLLIFGISSSLLLTRYVTANALHDLSLQTDDMVDRTRGLLLRTQKQVDIVRASLASDLVLSPVQGDAFLQGVAQHMEAVDVVLMLDQDHTVVSLWMNPDWPGQRQDYHGIDFSGHEFFAGGRPLVKNTWSNIVTSPLSEDAAVFFGAPLQQGSLLARLTLKDLLPHMADAPHHGQRAEVAITDKAGILIAHSRSEPVSQRRSLLDCPEVALAVRQGIETPAVLHAERDVLECVRIVPETGWVIRLQIPLAAALAQVSSVQQLLWACFGSAVALGLLATLLISARFARPLLALREMTGKIADGYYELDMPVFKYRELEDFSKHFKKMSAAVAQREDALRESEERFRTVFQTSPEAMLLTSLPAGAIVDANSHAETLSGYRREELVGQTTTALDLWADCDRRAEYLKVLAETGGVEGFEADYRNRSGALRNCLISARVIHLKDGAYLLAAIRDITEMKTVEKLLRQSEARFRSLVKVMGEGLIIQNRQGMIIECNTAAERILGVAGDLCKGRSCRHPDWQMVNEQGELCPPDQFPALQTFKTGRPVVNRLFGMTRPDGGLVWLQVNTQPLEQDEDGTPAAVVITFADVSRHKENERRLQAGEDRYRILYQQFQALLQAIPYRIDLRAKNLEVLWTNRENLSEEVARRLPPCGFRCKPVDKPVLPSCTDCPTARCFVSGHLEEGVIAGRRGSSWAMKTFPILDEKGEISQVIQMIEDVTERLIREQQENRNSQLAALGELAAGVAHEINNPINGIINYAQLILNRNGREGREQDLSARIIKEGQRIATIVRELLHFSRDESPGTQPIAIRDVLNEALALISAQLRQEGIDLRIEIQENLPLIETRGHQIQQIFLNVLSNARHALVDKYPGASPDKILAFKAEVVVNDGRKMVRCIFTDFGTGIRKDLLNRVLNPFVTTKPAGVGTGLGLSISHDIVKSHGGVMDIQSDYGQFTRVTIDLPALE